MVCEIGYNESGGVTDNDNYEIGPNEFLLTIGIRIEELRGMAANDKEWQRHSDEWVKQTDESRKRKEAREKRKENAGKSKAASTDSAGKKDVLT